MINTLQLFDTVHHEHLDTLSMKVDGEYPMDGLLLINCSYGKWFVEVEFGDAYNHVEGISRPSLSHNYQHPRFFDDRKQALQLAVETIRIRHPNLSDEIVAAWDEC